MLFLRLGSKRHKHATLKAIFIAPTAGEPMNSVNAIEAMANRGLQGDRYSEDRGHWKSIDGCQVTLITEHDLEQAKKAGVEFPEGLDHGSHRRNLVIAGLKTKQLEGKDFRIGTAVFRYAKPRP
ncbi:MAG: sulfurase, partial [Gammaproteobacteria bacterium]|nr:sulfurase [Gammaproteobacteria bacterium]